MKLRMQSITWRWLVNSLGTTFILVLSIQCIVILATISWLYGDMEQALFSRSEIYTTLFTSTYMESDNMEQAAKEFAENFSEKEQMELMILDQTGKVIITSMGFEPDNTAPPQDYLSAIQSTGQTGKWVGEQPNGERIMAVTRHFQDGKLNGSIRLLVSMSRVDRQIFIFLIVVLILGFLVLSLVLVTGLYFVRSIVNPVKLISMTAKKVAKGDFSARLEKKRNDELGELCDTVNYMAGELAAAERLKNDFISSVSHELRTPLTAIKGWAETIEICDVSENKEMVEKGVRTIAHEVERLSGMVEDLLDFSRMQSGRLTMAMDRMDLLAELEEAVYMFFDRASRNHIAMQYSAPEMLPPFFGDRNRIKQVFVNIIENAIKYSLEEGSIFVRAYTEDRWLLVEISDTGCGIAPEDLPKIKEKFYKANHTRGGSGIGLAIADEIVRLHGGELNITSELNVGTVVTIRLPIMEDATSTSSEDSK